MIIESFTRKKALLWVVYHHGGEGSHFGYARLDFMGLLSYDLDPFRECELAHNSELINGDKENFYFIVGD